MTKLSFIYGKLVLQIIYPYIWFEDAGMGIVNIDIPLLSLLIYQSVFYLLLEV